MSVEDFVVNAELRNDEGKGASRRLRRAGKVPAVIYGGEKEPQSVSLEHHVMLKHVELEAFYSHILKVDVAGKAESAVLKDIQWHPYKPVILHMDFQRVDAKSKIKIAVPVHFIGEDVAPGVKAGGVVSHQMNSVEVTCLAKALPEYLEADVSALNIGDSVHLSELKLPSGVEIVELTHGEGHDLPVVTVVATRGGVSSDAETEEAAAEGEDAAE